jgi:hypothetical protein
VTEKTRGIHKHSIIEKPNSSRRQGLYCRKTACVEHVLSPESPYSRSDSIVPGRHLARSEKAELSHHAHPRREDSLARDNHSPVIGDAHDHSFRWQDQRMTVITTERRVFHKSTKMHRSSFKKYKVDESSAMHLADDTNQNNSPPPDVLKRVFLPERKQIKRNKKT